ncbi:uncharacterized protein ACRADG_006654 isoform 1-T2 [Cochliomyia hominivorax]
MRRDSEHHHHATVPTVATATGAVATSSVAAVTNASTHNSHNLSLSTSNASISDSLNTPSTPLLNLGRSPLQFTAPPPPPAPIAVQPGPQFGFYTPTPTGTPSYFHHYTNATPTYAPPPATTVAVHHAPSNGTYATSTENCRSVAPPTEELEEFVDIFQVQHLLLDHSAANGNAPPPHSLMSTNSTTPPTASISTAVSSISTQTTATTTVTSNSTTLTSLAKPQPRPRLNLQKASEYAAQHQAESPSSRRMLLDYPSPYLYGNHYHTSPSEDLVALWFGGNGTGKFLQKF